MHESETPLEGGNVNAGVVKVGNTVRRAMGPHSKTIHRLLRHLEQQNFAYSPRFLGIDEKGREILSFIPGSTEFPDRLWQDDTTLVDAAKMLRKLHDATLGFSRNPSDNWAFSHPDTSRHDIICHVDFAPYNMVFDGAAPIGIIDFDVAGPGPRLWDIAYLAYWFAPLSFSSEDMSCHANTELANGSKRLKLLCASYGMDDYSALLDMVLEVLNHMGNEKNAARMIGLEAAQRLKEGGHFAHWQREARAFEANRSRIWCNFI